MSSRIQSVDLKDFYRRRDHFASEVARIVQEDNVLIVRGIVPEFVSRFYDLGARLMDARDPDLRSLGSGFNYSERNSHRGLHTMLTVYFQNLPDQWPTEPIVPGFQKAASNLHSHLRFQLKKVSRALKASKIRHGARDNRYLGLIRYRTRNHIIPHTDESLAILPPATCEGLEIKLDGKYIPVKLDPDCAVVMTVSGRRSVEHKVDPVDKERYSVFVEL